MRKREYIAKTVNIASNIQLPKIWNIAGKKAQGSI